MNTAELRLGNLVLDKKGEPQKVIEISQYGLKVGFDQKAYRVYASEFSPIPLTEGWLKECGFSEFTEFGTRYKYLGDKDGMIGVFDGCNVKIADTILPHIKHIHQLQNLYYDLTGKELTISL